MVSHQSVHLRWLHIRHYSNAELSNNLKPWARYKHQYFSIDKKPWPESLQIYEIIYNSKNDMYLSLHLDHKKRPQFLNRKIVHKTCLDLLLPFHV